MFALFAILAMPLFAEMRIDVGADIPINMGVAVSGIGGTTQTQSIDVLTNYLFLLPEASVMYQVPVGPMNFGIGVRGLSFIVESLIWPNLFAEANLGPVAIDFNVGGGAFLFFGLYNHLGTGSVWIPDLSAYFKIGKVFRLGAGVALLLGPDVSAGTSVVPYVFYFGGKFSFTL